MTTNRKPRVYIYGGGTISHVRPHLAIAAPAYGKVASFIARTMQLRHPEFDARLELTRMAFPQSKIETHEDLAKHVRMVVEEPETKMVFMTAAVVDFEGHLGSIVPTDTIEGGTFYPMELSGKDQPRLQSRSSHLMQLTPLPKILPTIREKRKDIFLVGFKTTAGATPDQQFTAGLGLLKRSSCNLVLANDVQTRLNMIITPEEARYYENHDRDTVIEQLVDMAVRRSRGTFTRSTVVDGTPVPWNSDLVPESLRTVVNHCIKRSAYKAMPTSITGKYATAGHFAVKLGEGQYLTSRRKTNFNQLEHVGLVRVESNGPDTVIAHGSRPSVGGQSQRIIFEDHPDADCIVHFHCPMREKPKANIPVRPQRDVECGSHECGHNTSNGLRAFTLPSGAKLYAVMLDQHGPNLVFNRNVNPYEVIAFIEENFDLDQKTDGIERPRSPYIYYAPDPSIGEQDFG